MRRISLLGLVLATLGSACHEEPDPVEETAAMPSTGEVCLPGTEGCPCIEGSCVANLSCFSNVCVDAGPMTGDTTTDEPVASTTAAADSTTAATLDEGSTTASMGDLPGGSPCDPLSDQCVPELGCVGLNENGFFCDDPGPVQQDEPCRGLGYCAAGLVCVTADRLDRCTSLSCCTALCDVLGEDTCPFMLSCSPLYPREAPPGYEHLGICVSG
jgi:hypothetical protein